MAVLGLADPRGRAPVPPDRMTLLATLIGPAALAYERVRLEADMRKVTVASERDRLRAALISSIGDDIRAPLTTVISTADALEKGAPDPALIATLRVETRRLGRFLADIADMTRVEAGALTVVATPTDLADAVAAAAHDLRAPMAPSRIRRDVPPDLPCVSVDPRLLNHMLVNLIDNAARHGGGNAPITLEGRRQYDGISLSVLDEGPGLAPEQAKRIFDGFLHGERRDRGNATGLGLAIVKGLGEAMAIGVSATNRTPERGACFTLHFPQALLVPATPPAA
jgi:two-component system sensor histidine kinase KdpD